MNDSIHQDLRRRWWLGAAVVVPCVLFGVAAAAGEWRHAAHDALGSNHADGAGRISSDAEHRPAVAWSVGLPATGFHASLFADVDGDGRVEALVAYQQRVAALDLLSLEVVWATPSLGITELVGLYDTDGDGEEEIVAVAGGMGGGVHVVDVQTGALVWSFTGLDEAAGVLSQEVRVADVDGDGADEIVFASGVNRTGGFYVADLSTPSGSPEVVAGLLQGTDYRNTTGFVIDDFDGDGVAGEIVVSQGSDLDLKRISGPQSCDGACSASFCLCDVAFVPGAFPQWALPNPPFSADLDGDQRAEYLSIHRHSTYADGVVSLELAPAFLGQELDPTALASWSYVYTGTPGAEPSPIAPGDPIADLDGDGAPEVFVTVFNAGTDETNLSGEPVDDGLSNPGGFSVLVVSGADGAPLASLQDRYAYGTVDLDGDGLPEIVTTATAGWTFDEAGPIEGWELSCSADPCTLELAWTGPGYTVTRHPGTFDDAGFPSTGLSRLAPDADGVPSLLAWRGDTLVSLRGAGASLVEVGALELPPMATLAGFDPLGDTVLVIDDGWVTPYDGALAPLGPPVQPTGIGRASWRAASLAPSERATAVLDGHLFLSDPAPSSLADADAAVRPNVALIRNVDPAANDLEDLFSFEYQAEQGRVLVSRHEADGAGGIVERWTWDSSSVADLARLRPVNRWPITAVEVDGDGVQDLVLVMERGGSEAIVALSGATGESLWILQLASRDAAYAPLVVADLTGPGGYGVPDGVPDLLRPSRRRLSVYELGADAPTVELLTDDFNSNYLVSDLDGDGVPEVIGAKAFAITEPNIEVYSLLPTLEVLWTSAAGALGPGPDTVQALALVEADGVPGPDVATISSIGTLTVLAGSTGAILPGFPFYLGSGLGSMTAPPSGDREPLTAVMSWDADGDSTTELIVGSRAGYLYSVDVSVSPPVVEWSYFVGGPVVGLAAADTNGDGFDELLLSTDDGVARVLDGLGLALDITSPGPDDCVSGDLVTVSGTSAGLETIDIAVASTTVVEGVIPAADGTWQAEVPVQLAQGRFEVVATGHAGVSSVTSQLIIDGCPGDDSAADASDDDDSAGLSPSGGCDGCAVGGGSSSLVTLLWGALLGLLGDRRRRRSAP